VIGGKTTNGKSRCQRGAQKGQRHNKKERMMQGACSKKEKKGQNVLLYDWEGGDIAAKMGKNLTLKNLEEEVGTNADPQSKTANGTTKPGKVIGKIMKKTHLEVEDHPPKRATKKEKGRKFAHKILEFPLHGGRREARK